MANPARFLAKILRVITRKRLVQICEFAGFVLLAAAAWVALGRAAGMAALGIVLIILGNSKGS